MTAAALLSPKLGNTGHRQEAPGTGLDTVLQFVESTALPVIGCYPSGAAIASGDEYGDPQREDYGTAWTSSPDTIRALWIGNGDEAGRGKGQTIRLFRCIPGAAGFVVLDIDRGHVDGGDGMKALVHWTVEKAIIIPAGFGRIHTRTPSGGYHYWHRYTGPRLKSGELLPSCEVFHYKALTVPGSERPDGHYRLYGIDGPATDAAAALNAATPLPPVLLRYIPTEGEDREPAKKTEQTTGNRWKEWERKKERGAPSLDQIASWTEQDGDGAAGRNAYAFGFARRARKHYTDAETLDYLTSCPQVSGLPKREIQTAVQSAYRGRR